MDNDVAGFVTTVVVCLLAAAMIVCVLTLAQVYLDEKAQACSLLDCPTPWSAALVDQECVCIVRPVP